MWNLALVTTRIFFVYVYFESFQSPAYLDEERSVLVLFSDAIDDQLSMFKSVVAYDVSSKNMLDKLADCY